MLDQPTLVQTSPSATFAMPPPFMMGSFPLHHFPSLAQASTQDLTQHVRLGSVNIVMTILPTINRRRAVTAHAKSTPLTRSSRAGLAL
jgi:hypothetical protein